MTAGYGWSEILFICEHIIVQLRQRDFILEFFFFFAEQQNYIKETSFDCIKMAVEFEGFIYVCFLLTLEQEIYSYVENKVFSRLCSLV